MQGTKTPQGGHAPGNSETVIGANCILGNFCPWYESHEMPSVVGNLANRRGTLIDAGTPCDRQAQSHFGARAR